MLQAKDYTTLLNDIKENLGNKDALISESFRTNQHLGSKYFEGLLQAIETYKFNDDLHRGIVKHSVKNRLDYEKEKEATEEAQKNRIKNIEELGVRVAQSTIDSNFWQKILAVAAVLVGAASLIVSIIALTKESTTQITLPLSQQEQLQSLINHREHLQHTLDSLLDISKKAQSDTSGKQPPLKISPCTP
jgi:hypothetical protein